MKLITWNIQWGRGVDGRVDLARVVDTARAMGDFDVLCLQEIADNYPGLEPPAIGNQWEQLAALLPGFHATEGVAVDRCTEGIGLYLWAELPQGVTDREYAARCREVGILVAPGSWFGKAQQRFVRIALGPTLEQCRAAVAAWPH